MATIFIYCNGAMVADREQKDRAAGATEPGAAALELYIEKHLSIVAKRTALARTGVDTQAAILEECDIGEIFAAIGIDGIGQQRQHRLTTADKRSTRVGKLDNDITAGGALIKECFHRDKVLVLPHHSTKTEPNDVKKSVGVQPLSDTHTSFIA
jgi:hypothetical protein